MGLWRQREVSSLEEKLQFLPTETVEVVYRNGWDMDAEAEFSPSLPLFVYCKGAQKKQELRVASQQALSWSFQSALSASLR